MPPPNVLAVIGVGGMGLAVARRLGSGRQVFLADFSQTQLDAAAKALRAEGHNVHTQTVDVAKSDAVRAFGEAAAAAGRLETVVHTAGLSPSMAPSHRIFDVDLVGTANVIDTFATLLPAGASLTCIASIARFFAPPNDALDKHLALAPSDSLLTHSDLEVSGTVPFLAYAISKRANYVRVQAAVRRYAERGARINSVSPGVIMTHMIEEELKSPGAGAVTAMIESNPFQRAGTPDEIASVVAFLAGPEAQYISGSDVVVDGGDTLGSTWSKVAAGSPMDKLAEGEGDV